MENEKQPLLEEGNESISLEELKQQVIAAEAEAVKARRSYHTAWLKASAFHRIQRRMLIGLVAGFVAFYLFLGGAVIYFDNDDVASYPQRIPLEAHIMSKCPDAKDCLRQMVLPAMQNVSNIVDFKLSYIGT